MPRTDRAALDAELVAQTVVGVEHTHLLAPLVVVHPRAASLEDERVHPQLLDVPRVRLDTHRPVRLQLGQVNSAAAGAGGGNTDEERSGGGKHERPATRVLRTERRDRAVDRIPAFAAGELLVERDRHALRPVDVREEEDLLRIGFAALVEERLPRTGDRVHAKVLHARFDERRCEPFAGNRIAEVELTREPRRRATVEQLGRTPGTEDEPAGGHEFGEQLKRLGADRGHRRQDDDAIRHPADDERRPGTHRAVAFEQMLVAQVVRDLVRRQRREDPGDAGVDRLDHRLCGRVRGERIPLGPRRPGGVKHEDVRALCARAHGVAETADVVAEQAVRLGPRLVRAERLRKVTLAVASEAVVVEMLADEVDPMGELPVEHPLHRGELVVPAAGAVRLGEQTALAELIAHADELARDEVVAELDLRPTGGPVGMEEHVDSGCLHPSVVRHDAAGERGVGKGVLPEVPGKHDAVLVAPARDLRGEPLFEERGDHLPVVVTDALRLAASLEERVKLVGDVVALAFAEDIGEVGGPGKRDDASVGAHVRLVGEDRRNLAAEEPAVARGVRVVGNPDELGHRLLAEKAGKGSVSEASRRRDGYHVVGGDAAALGDRPDELQRRVPFIGLHDVPAGESGREAILVVEVEEHPLRPALGKRGVDALEEAPGEVRVGHTCARVVERPALPLPVHVPHLLANAALVYAVVDAPEVGTPPRRRRAGEDRGFECVHIVSSSGVRVTAAAGASARTRETPGTAPTRARRILPP